MKIKFSLLVAFSAFLVAGCAAFFSVFGLSQLFAGAKLAVIIMASSLEVSKVVAVSLLQRYWSKISKGLKIYLAIGVFILVCITSAGIYGFLSNAYQQSATKYEISEGELSAINSKKMLFEKSIADNQAIVATKTKRIDQLTTLRTTQETRLDGAASNGDRSRARSDINNASKEIQALNTEVDGINAKITPLMDSVNVYSNKLIESKAKSTGAAEIGPLKYLAQLTGQPMDKVVNWFILLLIFVFDPLAVALVIATNKVMELENKTPPKPDETKKVLEELEQFIIKNTPLVDETTGEINLDNVPTTIDREYWIGNGKAPDEEEILRLTGVTESQEIVEEPAPMEVVPEPESIEEPAEEPHIEEHHDEEEQIEAVIEPVIEEPEPVVAPQTIVQKREPVITTGSVKLEEIKEVKAQSRGFSKDIPTPSNNTIQRIGSNSYKKRK